LSCFFFTPPSPTAIYTLSLHDALPIYNVALPVSSSRLSRRLALLKEQDGDFGQAGASELAKEHQQIYAQAARLVQSPKLQAFDLDRKSTRLNSSHRTISYAVFCLKKKK